MPLLRQLVWGIKSVLLVELALGFVVTIYTLAYIPQDLNTSKNPWDEGWDPRGYSQYSYPTQYLNSSVLRHPSVPQKKLSIMLPCCLHPSSVLNRRLISRLQNKILSM